MRRLVLYAIKASACLKAMSIENTGDNAMTTTTARLAATVLTREKGHRAVRVGAGSNFVLCWLRHSRAQQRCCISGILCDGAIHYSQVSRQNTWCRSRSCGDCFSIWIRRWPKSIINPRKTALTRYGLRLLPSGIFSKNQKDLLRKAVLVVLYSDGHVGARKRNGRRSKQGPGARENPNGCE